MKKIIALFSSLSVFSIGLMFPLGIAQATESCEGGACEVVFNKTEQLESWQVPVGVTEIEFEVYGAEGGSNGGRGGFVSGTLSNLPETLTIVVGGQGATGVSQNGGYNGGGFSGGRNGNPGSGGGASDIRFGSSLDDRIVVAGGGGGSGGPVGGDGGPGGGEIASDGSEGQGGAGSGGSQDRGGEGGRSNSGNTNGSSGEFGFGGEGGYAVSGYGGGGGGGGYYGGGGGGSDSATCCLDAGGGGGGSSFANVSFTSNVIFQPGFQEGDGKVILRYSPVPTITEFSFQQTGPNTAEVVLNFDSGISGVEIDDFVVAGCSEKELSGNLANYTLFLGGCESNASVSVAPNSFGPNSNSPALEKVVELNLDQIPPIAIFSHPEITNTKDFVISVETDSSGVFDGSAVSSLECELSSSIENNLTTIFASDCVEGEVRVVFETGFLLDDVGNSALLEQKVMSVDIDTISPVISVSDSRIEEINQGDEKQIQTFTTVSFSESIPVFEDFQFTGNDSCVLSFSLSEQTITLITESCTDGLIYWSLPAGSVSDVAGNLSPDQELVIEILIPEISPDPQPELETVPNQGSQPEQELTPQPEPAPESTPEPEPVQPPYQQPAPGPSVTPSPQPQPVPLPELVPTPDPESDPLPEPDLIVSPEPAAEEQPEVVDDEVEPEPVVKASGAPLEVKSKNAEVETGNEQEANRELEAPGVPSPEVDERQVNDSGPEQTLPVSAIQKNLETTEPESASPWAIGLASVLVLILVAGVVYLTKNNRSRTV